MIYIDTSVLIAYYCPEPLSLTAEAIIRAQNRPIISSLTEVEMFSALARKVREGELSKNDAERIAALFKSHCRDEFYRRIVMSEQHFTQAGEWLSGFTTSLRTLDALHIAVAIQVAERLVTADKGMASGAEYMGISVEFLSI